jgi:signal transduction histidine kinase
MRIAEILRQAVPPYERLWERTRVARDLHDTLLQTKTVSSERAL